MNVEYFLSLVRKYADIQELTGKIIRKLVKKIMVFKAEKVDGYRQQRIQMIYNAIGAVEIPMKKKRHSRYFCRLCRTFFRNKKFLRSTF